jgi:exodeoxyribonuclease VII small subunit
MANSETPFSLEATLEEIRGLIEKMQKGVADFDEQLALFKRGNDLIGASRAYLEEAELKVQELVEGAEPYLGDNA